MAPPTNNYIVPQSSVVTCSAFVTRILNCKIVNSKIKILVIRINYYLYIIHTRGLVIIVVFVKSIKQMAGVLRCKMSTKKKN